MRPTRARIGLWARTVVAAALCLLLLGAVVGTALALVGLPAFGVVRYGVPLLEGAVPTTLATVVVVGSLVVTLCCLECALRSIRTARAADGSVRPGPFAEGIVEVAAYVLLLASVGVALAAAPLASAALPTALFALLVLVAFFYAVVASSVRGARAWVRSRDDDVEDDPLERSTTGDGLVVGALGVVYLSAVVSELFAVVLVIAIVGVAVVALVAPGALEAVRARLAARTGEDDDAFHGLPEETRRLAARLSRAPGPRPAALVALAVVGLSAGVSVAATILAIETLAVALAAGIALLVVGGRAGAALRDEFGGDVAVLRALEDRSGLTALADATDEDPDLAALEATVGRLARQADVPAPAVRLLERERPEALTVGYRPATSTVVLSRDLVADLGEREREAVLAHELAHVANRDAAVLTALAAPRSLARLVTGRYGFNPVLEPAAAVVDVVGRWYVAFVARAREYAADDAAVAITGDPAGLASALEALDADLAARPSADLREQGATTAFSIVPAPWEEHRFFDRTRRLVSRGIFGTHPATERRIDRLRART